MMMMMVFYVLYPFQDEPFQFHLNRRDGILVRSKTEKKGQMSLSKGH